MLLGHAVSFLPEEVVQAAAGLMFLVGAVILIREGRSHQEAAASDEEFATKAVHGWRAVLASFLVLFAAEWGDLSQLLTISLVAKYEEPVAVFIGASARCSLVSGLAVVAGRQLQRFVQAARPALRRRRRLPAARRDHGVRAAHLAALSLRMATPRRRQRGRPAPDRPAAPARATS